MNKTITKEKLSECCDTPMLENSNQCINCGADGRPEYSDDFCERIPEISKK